jgi:hypothetical protein
MAGQLIIRYTDGTGAEEFFCEAPHDYAVHLSMLTTVDSARVEVSRPGRIEWHEYRDGARTRARPLSTAQPGRAQAFDASCPARTAGAGQPPPVLPATPSANSHGASCR